MSRYERNVYFEKLVTLKLRPWGDDDRRSVISIEDVIVYAEAVLLAGDLEAEAAAADGAVDGAAGAAPASTTPAAATTEAAAAATELDVPSPTATTDQAPRSRHLMDGWFGPGRGSGPAADTGA